MRRFLVVGQKATAAGSFLLDDVPGTSGRLDVLVRCVRPALLSSHGLRRDVVLYLLLLGGPWAPRVVRIDGREARFLRPDERASAVLLAKVLASANEGDTRGFEHRAGFVEVRPGIKVLHGTVDAVLEDVPEGTVPFVLDEQGTDIREVDLAEPGRDRLFVIGDHVGIPSDILALLDAAGAHRVSVGPRSIHAEDVVTLVTNELDRRGL